MKEETRLMASKLEELGKLLPSVSDELDRELPILDVTGQGYDAIDELRLRVKAVVWDLESTRRENEYLRKMLEEAG